MQPNPDKLADENVRLFRRVQKKDELIEGQKNKIRTLYLLVERVKERTLEQFATKDLLKILFRRIMGYRKYEK